MEKEKIKGCCMIAAFTVTFYLALSNLKILSNVLGIFMGLLTPFVIGLVIAFLLNGPVSLFEKKVYAKLKIAGKGKFQKLIRPLSLVSAYLSVIFALALLVIVVGPQITNSINQLSQNMPEYLKSLQQFIKDLEIQKYLTPQQWEEINLWLQGATSQLINLVVRVIPQLFDFVLIFGGGLFNAVIGIIVSLYLLSSKEQLFSQLSRINRAFLPKKASRQVALTAHITAETFSKYVVGQLTDALLVGVVSCLLLWIFRFPYALLIGVIMGITNIIPFFGPFIGAVPGVLILLLEKPILALWYILLVVIIQQIDGNIIAPKIIGDSVGLPALWVLFAVTVGGGVLGVAGMVLGTPVFAVFYQMLGRAVRAREKTTLHKMQTEC